MGIAPAHVRASLIGDLPDGEMFQCSISLKPVRALLDDPDPEDAIGEDVAGDPSGRFFDAATSFWSRAATQVFPTCVLRRVKLAPIGGTGEYSGSPREYAVDIPGGAEAGWGPLPHQMARKITLETDGDLGRVKGGFYLPGCTRFGFDFTTDLYTAEVTADLRESVVTFLDEVMSDPVGSEVQWQVVIPSTGRHNRLGAETVAPMLHDVKRVNVGRRIDVQRRRANKLSEARITDAVVDNSR